MATPAMPGLPTIGARANGRHHVELLSALALGCLYAALMSGHLRSIDGLLMYRQAVSIAYQHSLHFATPIWWGQPFTSSKYGIGLSLLYLPGLLAASPWQSLIPIQHGPSYDFGLLYGDRVYTVAAAPVHLVVAAASAYLVARFIGALGYGIRAALTGLGLYGLASPAMIYASGDTAELLTGLCWLGAVYGAARFRATAERRYLVGMGLALAYGILTRPVEGIIAVPAVLVIVLSSRRMPRWRAGDWQALAGVAVGAGAGIGLTLLVNWGRWGSPLTTGYENAGWTTPLPIGLAGALISPGRGMLFAFPAVLLIPLGLRRLWLSGHRQIAIGLAIPLSLQLINVAAWEDWWGGWAWGLRLFMPALPLIAVLAGIAIDGLPRRWWWAAAALGALGVLWALPGVVTDILGGYAARYDGSAASFALTAYPPIGAWRYFHHWRALTPADSSAADIIWLRLARRTANLSLLAPPILGMLAFATAWRARKWSRAC